MIRFNKTLPGARVALLLILPLLYILAAAYFRTLLGNLSLRSSDPEYIYFMSGLNLSEGTLKLAHIDNPGTPLQVLVALVFRITWLFRGLPKPYVEDVFLNPDLYLSVTSLFMAALTAGLLWYAGKKTLQYTNSVFYALLVQTAPFLPVIWYDLIGRVAPELMMPFPLVLMTVLLIKVYYQEKPVDNTQLFLFALLSAFGLSIKLTFLPIWLIPFLFIEGWKRKGYYLGLSLLLFFIIAFPMTLRLNVFWGWIKDLFMHSGQYGGGESNIIDLPSLRQNLVELTGLEKRFFYLFLTLAATLAGYLAWFRKKADKRLLILGLAVILSVALQVLMVGKHYAHRYFIPVLLLSPLMAILVAELVKKSFPRKGAILAINIAILMLFFINIKHHAQWLPIKTQAMGSDITGRMPTWHYAQLLEKDSYRIISSQNYGSPFIEYTLTYSHVWGTGRKRAEYAPILDKLYPNTYNYFTWDNTLKYWVKPFDAREVAESGKPVYLYLERDEQELFDKTLAKLQEESLSPFTANSELLYRNPATTEVIFRLILVLKEDQEAVSE
ncbi:MAG: hypothetical protein RBS53_03585 [Bacteroidales bacterium]|jgi:hypothetical protein|nr:hypothetical protein [Bacteroidales bacterium]NLM92629.1 hypothetical protein [Bacteroidales bacterium]